MFSGKRITLTRAKPVTVHPIRAASSPLIDPTPDLRPTGGRVTTMAQTGGPPAWSNGIPSGMSMVGLHYPKSAGTFPRPMKVGWVEPLTSTGASSISRPAARFLTRRSGYSRTTHQAGISMVFWSPRHRLARIGPLTFQSHRFELGRTCWQYRSATIM